MDLSSLITRGGVWYNVPGKDPAEFVEALAATLRLPAGVSPGDLAMACARREASSPTAMGRGLAFPHPGTPLIAEADSAMVALAYSRYPVDWKAPDGAPVRAAFLILSASRNEHLVTLSALAKLCGDAEFYAALGRRAAIEDIVALIGRKAKA